MPRYWMISDRTDEGNDFGADRGPLTYWTSDQGPLYIKTNWQQISADAFKAHRSGNHRNDVERVAGCCRMTGYASQSLNWMRDKTIQQANYFFSCKAVLMNSNVSD